MAERQTKSFYQNIGTSDTFSVDTKNKASVNDKSNEENLVINIGPDRKKVEKIYLKRVLNISKLTGNFIIDFFIRLNEYLIEHSKIKVKDIATIFRLLATMINAGIPLIKSLNTLGAQTDSLPRLQRVLLDLSHQVEVGSSLSNAMSKYPDVFTESQLGAVQAGEASGQLNKTFKNLAEEAEKSAAILSKVKGALIYPIAILIIMFVVVFLMMVLVVPQISGLYLEANSDLPVATTMLINASDFAVKYWWMILLWVVGIVGGIITWKNTKSGKYYWDTMLINLPIFGTLVKKSILAKFSYSFSNLLASGVPIIKAIEIISGAVGNEVYKKRLLLTAEDMKSGIPIAENLSNSSKLFPPMLVNMIEVGEQTAQLEYTTQKVAEFYNEEVANIVNGLTKTMEPMIIVVVGVVVGGLVAAIMLPILQLSSLVSV